MNYTSNKKLQKPLSNEKYDINIFNANMDLIDSELTKQSLKNISVEEKLDTHIGNTANPHKVNKTQIGLGNVENKSSAAIREEITKTNVINALGYTPYTPAEIDNKFSTLETNIDWKESVNSYNDIIAAYPNPQDGWTVNVKDTDYTYRYSGTSWVVISANAIPKATDSLDGLLCKEDHAKYDDAADNVENVTISPVTVSTDDELSGSLSNEYLDQASSSLDDALSKLELNDTENLRSGFTVNYMLSAMKYGFRRTKEALEFAKANFQAGCNKIAAKITACGVATANNASPDTMAANIQKIYDNRYNAGVSASKIGTASAGDVLSGKTFTNTSGSGLTGTMPNRGAVTQSLNCGGSYTIPAGYHNGCGKITANSLASQTSATAVAANITNGKTAWVNGVKLTGTGADNTTNYNNGYSAGHVAGTNEGYNRGYTDGVSEVKNSPNSYSLYTKTQYNANYTNGYNAGYNAGVAASQKTLQVRAKAHESGGVQYFYVRIYNGSSLVFDKGSNDIQSKDSAGYVTIDNFTV